MIDLTSEMIIEIHEAIIERYGGLPGISLVRRFLAGSAQGASAAPE